MKILLPLLYPLSFILTAQAADPNTGAPAVVAVFKNPADVASAPGGAAVTGQATEFERWLATLVTQYRAPFEREVQTPYETGRNDLKQRYLAILAPLLNNAVETEQIAEFLRSERQRIFDGQGVPPDDSDNPPAVLTPARAAYRVQSVRLEREHTRLAKLHFDRFDKVLADAQSRLLQGKRTDDAKLVLARREEIAHSWLPASLKAPEVAVAAVPTSVKSVALPPLNTSKAAARETAEWLLGIGAEIYVSEGLKEVRISDTKPLAARSITKVTIDGQKLPAPVPAEELKKIGSLKDLRILDIKGIPVDDQSLAFLKQMENLENVILYGGQCTDLVVEYLAGHAKLKIFRLHEAAAVTGRTMDALANARELRILDLNASGILDESAPALARLTQLESLCLNHTKVSNSALPTLALLTNLTELGLESTIVTPQGMQALKGMKRLETLQYLSTDLADLGETAKALGAVFPKMTSWRLNGDHVTADSLQALYHLHAMDRLLLSGTLDPGALAGLASLPGLSKLKMVYSDRSDADLEPLAALKTLKVLEIDGAKSLTEAFLEKMRRCRNLKELRLTSTSLPPQALATFAKQLPGCKMYFQ